MILETRGDSVRNMATPRKRATKKDKDSRSNMQDEGKKKVKAPQKSALKPCCFYVLLISIALVIAAAAYVWFLECPYEPQPMKCVFFVRNMCEHLLYMHIMYVRLDFRLDVFTSYFRYSNLSLCANFPSRFTH